MVRPLCSAALGGALALLAACAATEIEDGLSAADGLVYNQQYNSAHSLLQRLLERAEGRDDAVSRAQRLEILGRLGKLNLFYIRNYDEAIVYLRKIVEGYPRSEEGFAARAAIADVYADKLRQHPQAIVEYQELIAVGADRPNADRFQYALARSYYEMRNYEQAREAANVLLRRWPKSDLVGKAQVLVANTYFVQEEYEKALEVYRALLELRPAGLNAGLIQYEIASCHQLSDRHAEALPWLYQALETHPNPILVQQQIRHIRSLVKGREPHLARPERRGAAATTAGPVAAGDGRAPRLPAAALLDGEEMQHEGQDPFEADRPAAGEPTSYDQ